MDKIPHSASVIVNNYNYGRFLRRAIDSVLAQTRQPSEIVVVDDGSTDDSVEIIKSYGDRVVSVFKSNGGQASAINAAFRFARGDVIFILDSDDALNPDAIRIVLEAWKSGTVLIQYLMEVVDPEGKVLGMHPTPPHLLAEGDVRGEMLASGHFASTITSGMAFLRERLQEAMPIDESKVRMAVDGYLVRAVAMTGPVQAIRTCLARQCRHGQNDSAFRAGLPGLAASFRKKIGFTKVEIETVLNMAQRLGLKANEQMSERDATYLSYRLFSLRLEPNLHPITGDKVFPLLFNYYAARLRERDSLARRITDMTIATFAAAAPSPTVFPILQWRYIRESRPKWLRTPTALRVR